LTDLDNYDVIKL